MSDRQEHTTSTNASEALDNCPSLPGIIFVGIVISGCLGGAVYLFLGLLFDFWSFWVLGATTLGLSVILGRGLMLYRSKWLIEATAMYDYRNQAWLVNGKYEPCGHGDCHRVAGNEDLEKTAERPVCYGTLHAGEPVDQDARDAGEVH